MYNVYQKIEHCYLHVRISNYYQLIIINMIYKSIKSKSIIKETQIIVFGIFVIYEV